MSRLFLLAVLLLATATVPGANADAVVTLCQSDDQPGLGVNLTSAIAEGGSITFRCGGTATIRITHLHEIALSTAIDGEGAITLDGGGKQAMFAVSQGDINIRLDRLVLRGAGGSDILWGKVIVGPTPTGAIRVLISHSQIAESVNPIYVPSGSLSIEDTQFSNNKGATVVAGGGNARLDVSRSTFRNSDVPIFFSGAVGNSAAIIDSRFEGNDASWILGAGCSLTIVRSQFNGNTGSRQGSGGALRTSCDATIVNSGFSNNKAPADGGAIYLYTSTFPRAELAPTLTLRAVKLAGNSASGSGGAIAVEPSDALTPVLSVEHGTFTGNQANFGGAIDLGSSVGNGAELRVNGVTFSKNSAVVDGGAIHGGHATLNITRGVLVDNKAANHGGAISTPGLADRHVVLANSLFVRNDSGAGGSAFHGSNAQFINSTITANSGIAVLLSSATPDISEGRSKSTGSVRFTNSIIAGNQGGNCGSGNTMAGAVYLDGGHNLQFPGTECGASIPEDDPLLDTMYIPIVGSRALAGGDNQACMADPIDAKDVYGQRRPQGPACSIGAVEGDIQHLLNKVHIKQPDPWLGPDAPKGGGPAGGPPGCSYCCCKQ